MRRRAGGIALALVAWVLGAGFGAAEVWGQEAAARKPQPFHLRYEGNMAPLLAKLAQEFGVTVGLEVYPWRQRVPVKLELKAAGIEDVLDAVVRSEPSYRWGRSGGAIEFSSVGGGSPLLDARVESYSVSGADQAEANEQLMNLPEVRAGMGVLGLRYRSPEAAPSYIRGGARFSLALKGVTVRQALNEIAAKGGGYFWVFRRYGDKREGEFVTVDSFPR